MTIAWSLESEMNISIIWFCSFFLVLEAILLNKTAAKDRTWVSGDPAVCSARPMSRTSGRLLVQLLARASSAWERMSLLEDWRPWMSWPSSAVISAGSIDMLEAYRWNQGRGGSVRDRVGQGRIRSSRTRADQRRSAQRVEKGSSGGAVWSRDGGQSVLRCGLSVRLSLEWEKPRAGKVGCG